MRFLFLLHGDAEAEAPLPQDERMRIVEEHMAYTTMLRDLRHLRLGRCARRPRGRRSSCDRARGRS